MRKTLVVGCLIAVFRRQEFVVTVSFSWHASLCWLEWSVLRRVSFVAPQTSDTLLLLCVVIFAVDFNRGDRVDVVFVVNEDRLLNEVSAVAAHEVDSAVLPGEEDKAIAVAVGL